MKYILFVAILILLVFIILNKKNRLNKGKQGERQVSKILKKVKKSKLINNLKLPLYDTITEIDHILICKKGIVVVETKSISGSIYGNINQKELIHKIGTKTHKLYNPVYQNKTHVDNVKHHLRKNGYNNIPIYSLIVFTDNNLKIHLKGKSNADIIKISQLKLYVKSLPKPTEFIDYKEIYLFFCNLNIKKNYFIR